MGRKLLSGVASTIFTIAAVAGAGAQTIEIGVGPPGSVVEKASGPAGSAPVFFAAPGPTWTATADDAASGADLDSTNITVSENFSGELVIWVTETGINLGPTPQELSLLSDFTQNALPPGASITDTTWFDPSDTAFGTVTKLATSTFTSSGTNDPGVTTVVDAPAPYSITEEYDVKIPFSPSTGPGVLSTTLVQTTTDGPIPVIPEPSTWMMMALGFAGLGYAGYARSRKSQVGASVA